MKRLLLNLVLTNCAVVMKKKVMKELMLGPFLWAEMKFHFISHYFVLTLVVKYEPNNFTTTSTIIMKIQFVYSK